MAHIISAANPAVGFYRGVQANLEALSSNGGYRDGAFYITTDTDRLYYAQSSTELVYLNKSIQIVSNESELKNLASPIIGEFYYVSDSNKLAYYAGNSQFVQVNYYVDTNTSIKTLTSTANVTAETKGDLQITTSIQQQNKDGTNAGSAISATATVSTADILKLIQGYLPNLGDIQVTLNATVATNKATVSLGGTGSHASDKSFTIQGSTGVTVEGSNDAITIKGTTYTLDNDSEAKVVLKDNDSGVQGTVTFSAGNDDIVITPTSGNIEIGHKTYSATSKSGAVSSGQVNFGQELTLLKGVTLSNGHVTGVTTEKITLPAKPEEIYATGINADNAGKITVTMNSGSTFDSGADLYYTIDGNTYYNQANLTDAIKNLISKDLTKITNAMTFKGGLTGGASSATPISQLVTSAAVGDVYIVASGTVSVTDKYDTDTTANKGDIVIANGTEDPTTGLITSATLEWIVIEGTEADTHFRMGAASNKITLSEKDGGVVSTITLADDDKVTLTSANNTVTAKHAKITTGASAPASGTKVMASSGTFQAVTKLTNDGYGHITDVETTTIQLPADQTNNHTLTGNATSKTVILKNASGTDQGSIVFAAGTATAAAVTVDGNKSTVKFNHSNVTRSDTDNTSTAIDLIADQTFDVVVDVKSNSQGHITGVTTQKYKAVDTKYSLSGATVSATSNVATVTDTLKTTGGADAGTSVFKLGASATSNLQVTANSNQINLGLVWGTF